MRELNTTVETVTKSEVISITCDKCGKTEEGENIEYASSIETWKHNFGYGSKFDTDMVSFELCDDCYEEFIKSFKYPPKINSEYDD